MCNGFMESTTGVYTQSMHIDSIFVHYERWQIFTLHGQQCTDNQCTIFNLTYV